jgi:hypothetical protein
MNTDYCKKCGSCCKQIKINKDKLLWDGEIKLSEEFKSMLIPIDTENNIYTCKYLHNNLCTNPDKPDICKNYPSFAFTKLPDGCGYEGYLFIAKEKIRHKIRKMKEEVLDYTILCNTSIDKREIQQYNKIIESHQRFINKYMDFDSENW